MIAYILKVGKTEHRQYIYDRVKNNLSKETSEDIMSIANDIFKDGKIEAEHKIVSRQLARKFGQLSPEIIKRLKPLSEDEIEQVGYRLLRNG